MLLPRGSAIAPSLDGGSMLGGGEDALSQELVSPREPLRLPPEPSASASAALAGVASSSISAPIQRPAAPPLSVGSSCTPPPARFDASMDGGAGGFAPHATASALPPGMLRPGSPFLGGGGGSVFGGGSASLMRPPSPAVLPPGCGHPPVSAASVLASAHARMAPPPSSQHQQQQPHAQPHAHSGGQQQQQPGMYPQQPAGGYTQQQQQQQVGHSPQPHYYPQPHLYPQPSAQLRAPSPVQPVPRSPRPAPMSDHAMRELLLAEPDAHAPLATPGPSLLARSPFDSRQLPVAGEWSDDRSLHLIADRFESRALARASEEQLWRKWAVRVAYDRWRRQFWHTNRSVFDRLYRNSTYTKGKSAVKRRAFDKWMSAYELIKGHRMKKLMEVANMRMNLLMSNRAEVGDTLKGARVLAVRWRKVGDETSLLLLLLTASAAHCFCCSLLLRVSLLVHPFTPRSPDPTPHAHLALPPPIRPAHSTQPPPSRPAHQPIQYKTFMAWRGLVSGGGRRGGAVDSSIADLVLTLEVKAMASHKRYLVLRAGRAILSADATKGHRRRARRAYVRMSCTRTWRLWKVNPHSQSHALSIARAHNRTRSQSQPFSIARTPKRARAQFLAVCSCAVYARGFNHPRRFESRARLRSSYPHTGERSARRHRP